MKNSKVLIAVLAVLAAASAAKAGEISVDFDGRGSRAYAVGSVVNDDISITHAKAYGAGATTINTDMTIGQVKAAPAIDPAGSAKALHSDDPCCDNPMILCFVPCTDEDGMIKSQPAPNFGELAKYYMAQDKIKAEVAAYFQGRGDGASAAVLAAKDVRICAENGSVLVFRDSGMARIEDAGLASRVDGIVHPRGQQKIANIIAGAAFVGGCMVNKDCWDAVGDGVSTVSEHVANWYYSN